MPSHCTSGGGVSVVDEDGKQQTHCSWRRRTLTRWHSPCRHGQRFRPHSTHTQLLLFRGRTCARVMWNSGLELEPWPLPLAERDSARCAQKHLLAAPSLSDIPSYCFWFKSHLSPLAFLFLAEKMSFVLTAWVPLKFVFQEVSRVHTTRRKSLYWQSYRLQFPVSLRGFYCSYSIMKKSSIHLWWHQHKISLYNWLTIVTDNFHGVKKTIIAASASSAASLHQY